MSIQHTAQSIISSWESESCEMCKEKELRGKCHLLAISMETFYYEHHFCSPECASEKTESIRLKFKDYCIKTLPDFCSTHGSKQELILKCGKKHSLSLIELNPGHLTYEKIVEIYQKNFP